MSRSLLPSLACLALAATPALPAHAQTSADPEALRAESLMVEAMGGRDAWESARFFDFVWAIERGGRTRARHHVWDRWTGRYRLEMPLGDQEMVALFSTRTKDGRVWLDGRELTGDTVQTLLERAYAVHINDAYWFVMPFKWRDPGVSLAYHGTVRDTTGKAWERIELTFANVGLTPDNRYYAYLDPETHLMGWWEHFRHRDDPEPALVCHWRAWERRGPIVVSLDRPFIGSDARIHFPRARVATEVDEDAFAPPGS